MSEYDHLLRCITLSSQQQALCVQLLDVIVRPGDHEFQWAIEASQKILGYEVPADPPRRVGRPRKEAR